MTTPILRRMREEDYKLEVRLRYNVKDCHKTRKKKNIVWPDSGGTHL